MSIHYVSFTKRAASASVLLLFHQASQPHFQSTGRYWRDAAYVVAASAVHEPQYSSSQPHDLHRPGTTAPLMKDTFHAVCLFDMIHIMRSSWFFQLFIQQKCTKSWTQHQSNIVGILSIHEIMTFLELF